MEGAVVIKLEPFQRVTLARDIPEYGLRRGDVGTITDLVPYPQGGERGCVVEFFNAVGESFAVAIVAESQVHPLRADEVLAVRPLARVS
jgi:hypothetical protein